ncbi:hypothetical protein ALT761_03616 [Alteromonas sp. 76-1]|nr:hypothetical protein ALT761_03616 [Alteromonas sp. 76-1]
MIAVYDMRLSGIQKNYLKLASVRHVCSVVDSYDNALVETINGLYKTEVIHENAAWNLRKTIIDN